MGLCKNNGKTFGELMQNLMSRLDESYIMADADKNIRIIGSADRKKHEKFFQTSEWRCMYTIRECVYIIFVIWNP